AAAGPRGAPAPAPAHPPPQHRGERDDAAHDVGALGVRGEHDLVHLAGAGEQQLAHRLAALHLGAAQTPLTPLAPTAWRGRAPRRTPLRCSTPRCAAAPAARRAHAAPSVAWMSAEARQAMPSTRPSAPSRSARRPATVTGAPTTSLSRRCISSLWGASLGRSAITEQSTFTGSQPASRTRRTTS